MRRLTERLLGQTVTANPMKMDLGYGNENWRVECGGRTLLVKIAKQGHPVAKAESASRAQRLAHASGAPVAREVLLDTRSAKRPPDGSSGSWSFRPAITPSTSWTHPPASTPSSSPLAVPSPSSTPPDVMDSPPASAAHRAFRPGQSTWPTEHHRSPTAAAPAPYSLEPS